MKKSLSIIIWTWGFMVTASAQNDSRVITTAVLFLRVSGYARASGMGNIGLATTSDVFASFWNMGKIPFNEKKSGIGVSYSHWMRDIAGDITCLQCRPDMRMRTKQKVIAATLP